MLIVRGILIRVVAVIAGAEVYKLIYQQIVPSDPSNDADFGFGLILFGLVLVAALAWGAWDGLLGDVGRVAQLWTGTAIVLGLVVAGRMLFNGEHMSTAQRLGDMGGLGLFAALLVGVPAVSVGVLVAGLRGPKPTANLSDAGTAGSR